MVDFLMISTRSTKRGSLEIYPKFIIKKSKDLMIRGGDFYAIWIEEKGVWSTDEQDAIHMIDNELDKYAKEHYSGFENGVQVLHLWDAESGMIDRWHRYCQVQMRDNYHPLDENLIWSNDPTKKEDYSTKRLSYPLQEGSIEAYDKLLSTLYSPEERHKIEWAIGSVVTGDSKWIQKFIVLYGSAGTGKSTVINIIQKLFDGYHTTFDSKALGTASASFALEPFKNNPLLGIQHDGDLSRIEDNTRLNSLVSHEVMTVNEKFKSTYPMKFNAFLILGTNRPVKITDAKSGIIRRLIDIEPTGKKIPVQEYRRLVGQVDFELGAIACHCRDVYLSNPGYYDDYIPIKMIGATNDFYNFMLDSYFVFSKEDMTTVKAAWEMYKTYCDYAKVPYSLSQRSFREELGNYFDEYIDQMEMPNGETIYNAYRGFKVDKFKAHKPVEKKKPESKTHLIKFNSTTSIFDDECKDCPAQYGNDQETPMNKWEKVKTKLSDLDTTKLHYVKVPENHIVIDFDIPDENGKKCFEKNLEEASKWPATYAELSKSGAGIHLHYIYTGDPTKLSRVYDDHIEIKVFTGNSSLRRKLSKCNDLPISPISSGLPLKGDKQMIDFDGIKSEKALRTMIKRNLNKEYHPATKPSIDFIYKILEDAYNSGLKYDVTDMRNAVLAFAASSTNQSEYCVKLVNKMAFKTEEPSEHIDAEEKEIVFFDVEVFPNLFLVNYKFQGKDKPVIRLINPTPAEIEVLLKYRLVGFNNRDYDNHMLYACLMGYSNEGLYKLSNDIINGDPVTKRNVKFGEAYNLSYTDVYDFCSKKQSLKKWEIELGIRHHELGLPWDQPVPKSLWDTVAEYCDNDVIATEAVYDARQADLLARKIQVDLVRLMHGIEMSVNDTTNELSKRIIFGRNRKPQDEFNWRDMSKPVGSDRYKEYKVRFGDDYKFRVFDDKGLPVYRDYIPNEELPKGYSILPFFPEYEFNQFERKSVYLGQEIGEGGRVYAEPGMYGNVWDGDVASMHPHSIIFEMVFGPKYTKVYKELVDARVAIKHKDFETAGSLLNGALKPYLNPEQAGDLAQAIKIILNSVYGLTAARFVNEFRSAENVDNIVAKRGALFMTLLTDQVQKRGYTVCHNKTDSIKIPDATPEIIEFVTKFGKEYGYDFETEAEFEKYCLVNDAVYIAKDKDGRWTATGTQFAVPYVFKTLFDKMPIEFDDLCELKSVKKGAMYLDKNEDLEDITPYETELSKRQRGVKRLNPDMEKYSDEDLEKIISDGHNYVFIGRVGEFCPMKPGAGGGELVCINENKIGAVTGTKGYRWMESAMVKELGKEADIDKSYYDRLVNEAVETISQFGDFEWFVSDDPYIGPAIKSDPLPASFDLTDAEMAMDISQDYQDYY